MTAIFFQVYFKCIYLAKIVFLLFFCLFVCFFNYVPFFGKQQLFSGEMFLVKSGIVTRRIFTYKYKGGIVFLFSNREIGLESPDRYAYTRSR